MVLTQVKTENQNNILKGWSGTVDNEVNQRRFPLLESADMDPKLGIKTT